MNDWWKEFGPPIYISYAASKGLIKSKKPQSRVNPTPSQPSGDTGDLNELLKMAGPGGMFNG